MNIYAKKDKGKDAGVKETAAKRWNKNTIRKKGF